MQNYWDGRYINAEENHELLKIQDPMRMYAHGSGLGSRGALREMKALFVNFQVAFNCISSILDVGCGDGYQQQLLKVEEYTGTDFSSKAIEYCRKYHQSNGRTFEHIDEVKQDNKTFDMTISLDVIMHILDINALIEHIDLLDKKSNKFILIYSSNFSHSMHEKFTSMRSWDIISTMSLLRPEYKQVAYQRNLLPWTKHLSEEKAMGRSVCDFFVYEKGRIDNSEDDRKYNP